MSSCANSPMEPYEGINGGIYWDDNTFTPLAYARHANNRERKPRRIELDGVNYVPARECRMELFDCVDVETNTFEFQSECGVIITGTIGTVNYCSNCGGKAVFGWMS